MTLKSTTSARAGKPALQNAISKAEQRELLEKMELLFKPVRGRIRKSSYDHVEVENALMWLEDALTKLLAEATVIGFVNGVRAAPLLNDDGPMGEA